MTETVEPVGHPARRGFVALGAAVAVVAVLATPLLLNGGSSPTASPAASPPSAGKPSVVPWSAPATPAQDSSGPATHVITDGATVEATGRIVSVPGKPTRICAPEMVDAVGYAPGHEPAPAWCPVGVDVTGVDLATLQLPRSKKGATEGYGYVRGVYRAGTIAASVQSTQRASTSTYSTLTTPPCPKPAGGWHRETRGSNPVIEDTVAGYDTQHPGQVVSRAIFRPNDTTGVEVLAVKDLAAARAALPADPGSLCLVAAKYTATQVTAAEAPFVADQTAHATRAGAQVVSLGQGVGPDGQTVLDVQVIGVTAQVEAWAAAAPAGLVDLIPWMAVVAPDAPLPALLPTGEPTVSPASASLYASEDAAYPSAAPASSG